MFLNLSFSINYGIVTVAWKNLFCTFQNKLKIFLILDTSVYVHTLQLKACKDKNAWSIESRTIFISISGIKYVCMYMPRFIKNQETLKSCLSVSAYNFDANILFEVWNKRFSICMLHFDLFMILLDSMKHHFNLESAKRPYYRLWCNCLK